MRVRSQPQSCSVSSRRIAIPPDDHLRHRSLGRNRPCASRCRTRATLPTSEHPAMEAVLSQNYAALAARRRSAGASREQLSWLALGVSERPQSFAEWLVAQGSTVNQRDGRLDALMAEIETLDDEIVQRLGPRCRDFGRSSRTASTNGSACSISSATRRRADEILMERLREVRGIRTLGTPETRDRDANRHNASMVSLTERISWSNERRRWSTAR